MDLITPQQAKEIFLFIQNSIEGNLQSRGIYRYSSHLNRAFELAARTGGTVEFPAGATTLRLAPPYTDVAPFVKVSGIGAQASKIIGSFRAIDNSATQYPRYFENFKLVPWTDAQNPIGLHLGGFAFSSARQLYIRDFKSAICLENTTDEGEGSIGTWTENLRIDHCYITNCLAAIEMLDSAPTRIKTQSFADQCVTGLLVNLSKEGSTVLKLDKQTICYGGLYNLKIFVEANDCSFIDLAEYATLRDSFFHVFIEFASKEYEDSFTWCKKFNETSLFLGNTGHIICGEDDIYMPNIVKD